MLHHVVSPADSGTASRCRTDCLFHRFAAFSNSIWVTSWTSEEETKSNAENRNERDDHESTSILLQATKNEISDTSTYMHRLDL